MAFHIVMPRPIDLKKQADDAKRGVSPRHAIGVLASSLNAIVHQPTAERARLRDKLWAKTILPNESLWALARRVKSRSAPNDVIFCPSEAGGLQIGAICGGTARPRVAMFVHNVDRPRARMALRMWRMDKAIDLFLACSQNQVDFLTGPFGISADRVRYIWDHTDNLFFSPGPARKKTRPLVVSVGLEQRDYRTLARATEDLDVDVKISCFSRDTTRVNGPLPETLPGNMTASFYEWPDLVQLYRDADVVVVSCFENRYAAGVQSLMEAASCARPIIVTTTTGLKTYIQPSMISVAPGNADQMGQAIRCLLENSSLSGKNARNCYRFACDHFNLDRYTQDIENNLRSLC